MDQERLDQVMHVFMLAIPVAVFIQIVMNYYIIKGWKEENPKGLMKGWIFLQAHYFDLFFRPSKILNEPYASRLSRALIFFLILFIPFFLWSIYNIFRLKIG